MTLPNIVVYANCQSKGIIRCLDKVINAKYIEITNYDYIQTKKDLPIDILRTADIFIYQPIDIKHGIYSTDQSSEKSICTYLSPTCKKISFPYIYNSAMWTFIPEQSNIDNINDADANEKYKDIEAIRKLKSQGYSLDVIKTKFLNGEIDFKYQQRFDKCMNILRQKESICDIKVADFIVTNIRNMKLFMTQNHPTTQVFIFCANQILSILNYNYLIDTNYYYDPNIANLPGDFIHTTYDIRFWKFKYPVLCCDTIYINMLEDLYNSIKD